ncbi:ATP-binding protein [Streptomyces sp. NPDC087843]|uniref:ATP-binding protein n=1 Tax=Streptomyces sp. NPDC087843 TaxID=3365804 RepID=UPI0037F627A9
MNHQPATAERDLPSLNSPRFVGRDDELRELLGALAHPPAVVLVEGEAGIGKSRLIREMLDRPEVLRRRALMAACPPFLNALTLAPVVDAVQQGVTGLEGLELSPLAGTLRPLFPEWTTELPPAPEVLTDAGAARHRLMRALAELLDQLRVEVLVVEDVHWADDATVDFLLFIAFRPATRISLVLSYRPEDLPVGSPLARLSSRPAADGGHARITLGALGVAETSELVSSMLGGEHVSAGFAALLYERTDGLPLALEESVRLLRDRADLIRQHDAWIRRPLDDIAVPVTIRDAVTERAGRLGPHAQRILAAAAVLGEPVAEATLVEVAALPAGPAVTYIDEALSGGLLFEDGNGRIAFRHVLAARAVYDTISGRERRAAHRRAGEALSARRQPPVARLAHHFRQAGDTARWSQYAEQAADLALASGDHHAAVSFLHELLADEELPGTVKTRLVQKLPIYAFTGHVGLAQVVRTLSAVLDNETLAVHERAEVRAQLGAMLMQVGEYGEGAAELERAIPDLARRVDAAKAMVVLGRAGGADVPAATHRRWLDGAARLMDGAIPAEDRASLQVDIATGLLAMGERSGWSVGAQLLDDPRMSHVHRGRGLLNLGDAAMSWGRHAEARERLTSAIEWAEQHGHQRLGDMARETMVHLDWYEGRWTGLVERSAALASLEEEPVIWLDSVLVGALFEAVCGSGAAAEEKLRTVMAEGDRRGIEDLPLEPAAALARMRLGEKRTGEALELTERPMAVVAAKGTWLWAREIAPVRVEALMAADRESEATGLVDAFADGLGDCDAPSALAALDSCRAVLIEGRGEFGRAAAAWERAAAAWEALPQPYEALLARHRQGACMLAHGEHAAALPLLSGVHDSLVELGAQRDAAAVGRTLRAHGASARPVWRGGRRGYGDQLSPRELEVARLMLGGLTTPEIAQLLSRSPKTVAAQLNSAMRKYGVSSRTALAVGLTQAGITPAEY